MIKIESEATKFLVQKLCGVNIAAVLTDEKSGPVSIRVEEQTLKSIAAYVEKTGWSRNTVIAFLLQGGIEIVETQLRQEAPEVQIELPLGKGKRK